MRRSFKDNNSYLSLKVRATIKTFASRCWSGWKLLLVDFERSCSYWVPNCDLSGCVLTNCFSTTATQRQMILLPLKFIWDIPMLLHWTTYQAVRKSALCSCVERISLEQGKMTLRNSQLNTRLVKFAISRPWEMSLSNIVWKSFDHNKYGYEPECHSNIKPALLDLKVLSLWDQSYISSCTCA